MYSSEKSENMFSVDPEKSVSFSEKGIEKVKTNFNVTNNANQKAMANVKDFTTSLKNLGDPQLMKDLTLVI